MLDSFIITVFIQRVLIKKENTVKKFFFASMCITTSFLCSMEPQPTGLTIMNPDRSPSCMNRSKKISDPFVRVRSQSQESPKFVNEENLNNFITQRRNKDEKK